jgi:hypothetical protein
METERFRIGLSAVFVAGCLAGAAVAALALRPVAHADTTTLPVIFQVGAQLKSPIGPIEIREVQGGWIRVKSLHVLAAADSEHQWMFVPSLAGTWIPDEGDETSLIR